MNIIIWTVGIVLIILGSFLACVLSWQVWKFGTMDPDLREVYRRTGQAVDVLKAFAGIVISMLLVLGGAVIIKFLGA